MCCLFMEPSISLLIHVLNTETSFLISLPNISIFLSTRYVYNYKYTYIYFYFIPCTELHVARLQKTREHTGAQLVQALRTSRKVAEFFIDTILPAPLRHWGRLSR